MKKDRCRDGGGEWRRREDGLMERRERERKRRSDMGVLTHSDPSPCFTSGIMGIYTLA